FTTLTRVRILANSVTEAWRLGRCEGRSELRFGAEEFEFADFDPLACEVAVETFALFSEQAAAGEGHVQEFLIKAATLGPDAETGGPKQIAFFVFPEFLEIV